MAYNIIIDIDQTIVDSSCVEELRKDREWSKVYEAIDAGKVKPFAGIVELICDARIYGHEIVFVSTSPETYCRKILDVLGLDLTKFNGLVPYDAKLWNGNKVEFYHTAIRCFKNQYQPLVIIGDSEKDISAAYGLRKDQYNVFTVRCLWGVTRNRILQEEKDRPLEYSYYPCFIIKSVPQLRDFLFYKWSLKQDEFGNPYFFDFYPTGRGKNSDKIRYHDLFSEFIARDIKGFSKSISRKPIFVKEWAIQACLSFTKEIIKRYTENKPSDVGMLIVPSSKAKEWNIVLEEIVKTVATETGIKDCSHLIVRRVSKDQAHASNSRSLETNIQTMGIDSPEIIYGLSILIVLDDITTTGKSFIACRRVLRRDASKAFQGRVITVALSKTKDFELPNVLTNVCEPNREKFEKIKYPEIGQQNKYWAVNKKYRFELVGHTKWECVHGGVKWGFPTIDGLHFYMPSGFLPCANCARTMGVLRYGGLLKHDDAILHNLIQQNVEEHEIDEGITLDDLVEWGAFTDEGVYPSSWK